VTLGNGPFSDRRVVNAMSAAVAPVYVNFKSTPGKKVGDEFGVTKLPTLILASWKGEKIEAVDAEADARTLAQKIVELGQKHRRDLPWAESLEKAMEAAKKDGKLVAVSYAEKPEEENVLREGALWPLVKDFVWARRPKAEAKARKLKSPTVVVIDPEKPEEPLLKLEGRKGVKEIEKALKEFLESRSKK